MGKTVDCNFLALLLFLAINHAAVSGEIIALFSQPNGQGDALEINADKCIVLPRGWNDKVSSVRTNGHCFELFDNKHCSGHSIQIDLHPQAQRHRVTNLDDLAFDRMTGSIKPCVRAEITSQDIAYNPYVNQPLPGNTVTVYELADRAGRSGHLRLTGCKNLPPHLYQNVASVDTRGTCIRMYEENDCGGNAIQLQPNDQNANNLHFYDFIDKTASVGPCLGGRGKRPSI